MFQMGPGGTGSPGRDAHKNKNKTKKATKQKTKN